MKQKQQNWTKPRKREGKNLLLSFTSTLRCLQRIQIARTFRPARWGQTLPVWIAWYVFLRNRVYTHSLRHAVFAAPKSCSPCNCWQLVVPSVAGMLFSVPEAVEISTLTEKEKHNNNDSENKRAICYGFLALTQRLDVVSWLIGLELVCWKTQ